MACERYLSLAKALFYIQLSFGAKYQSHILCFNDILKTCLINCKRNLKTWELAALNYVWCVCVCVDNSNKQIKMTRKHKKREFDVSSIALHQKGEKEKKSPTVYSYIAEVHIHLHASKRRKSRNFCPTLDYRYSLVYQKCNEPVIRSTGNI